jgi:hypothetical protein
MQGTKENLNECAQKLLELEPDKKTLMGQVFGASYGRTFGRFGCDF